MSPPASAHPRCALDRSICGHFLRAVAVRIVACPNAKGNDMPRKPRPHRSDPLAPTRIPCAIKSSAAPKLAVPREHGRFDYSAIVDRPPLRWPNGARVALWVIPNIEHFLFDRPATRLADSALGLNPDVLNYSWRDYGVRVGIWRMMGVMEKHGVKGTVALNADVCRHYPRIIAEGRKLGWEWMGHGITNSIMFRDQSEAEECAQIKEAVATITASVGKAPRGWLSPALSKTVRTLNPGRARHRVCRQLGERRPALSDAGEEG